MFKGSIRSGCLVIVPLLLVACHVGSRAPEAASGPTDAQLVDRARDDLHIGYAPGDGPGSVTRNITLPATTLHEVTVTWNSSSPEWISPTGLVQRPTGPSMAVTLTATLHRGAASAVQPFNLALISSAAGMATPDGSQVIGIPQVAGSFEHWPSLGEPVAGGTAQSAEPPIENRHGFMPPLPNQN